jgi:hypothetical protein
MNALKLVVLTALFSSPLAAQEPQVEKRSAPAPQGVAESIASALSPEGFRFSVDGKTVAEFWFGKSSP